MGIRRLSALIAVLAALAAGLLAPAAANATTEETRRLTIIRINCDDEAEHFSDEVILIVGGENWGYRSDMDGGDWWDIGRSVDFEDTIHVELWENDNWMIGEADITVGEAGWGVRTRWWNGFHGTHFQYRLVYMVE